MFRALQIEGGLWHWHREHVAAAHLPKRCVMAAHHDCRPSERNFLNRPDPFEPRTIQGEKKRNDSVLFGATVRFWALVSEGRRMLLRTYLAPGWSYAPWEGSSNRVMNGLLCLRILERISVAEILPKPSQMTTRDAEW